MQLSSITLHVDIRAAPKAMCPILCWPTMSKAGIDGMAAEVEPSY